MKIFTASIALLACITLLGQHVYFSNTPLAPGMEDSLQAKNVSATDADFLYAMLVADKVPFNLIFLKDYCIAAGNTLDLKGNAIIENNKTYIFYDILPDPQNPGSSDAEMWANLIQLIPLGQPEKIAIETIIDDVIFSGSLHLTRKTVSDQELVSRAQQATVRFTEIQAQKEREREIEEQARKDEEDRQRHLPAHWKQDDLKSISNEPDLSNRKKIIMQLQQGVEGLAEVIYLNGPKADEWKVYTRGSRNMVTNKRMIHSIPLVYKGTDGWCYTANVYFLRRNIGGMETEYGPLEIDVEEGTRLDCSNTK